jgi:hypothetical protein
MEEGSDAGILLAKDRDGTYSSPSGTKGYRFMESEYVKDHSLESKISKSYYRNLIDGAIDAISKFGDYEWFVSDDPVGYSMSSPKTLADYMNEPETPNGETEVIFE